MAVLTIRAFEAGDSRVVAELLAARHRLSRARLPLLSEPFESAGMWEPQLGAVHAPDTDAAVAERDGRVVGFLAGDRMLLGPRDFASLFVPPHSISMSVSNHAVAIGEDVTDVYRALYAHLAAKWVARGFFVHRAGISAADPEVNEAWVTLGFGRFLTGTVRHTGPVDGAGRSAGVEVHRAAAEDIDAIMRLVDTLNLHHAQSPMFWPILPATDDAARGFNLDAVSKEGNPYFVAYQDGRPVALQSFLQTGFAPLSVGRTGVLYLYDGVVEPDVRGNGVGSYLLDQSMAWAREHGYERCSLHFASGNPSGGPFWLGHGFTPVEYTMERRVDDRIAWAKL